MAVNFISLRNLRFLLYEVLHAETLTQRPAFSDHDRAVFDMVLETADKMGRDLLWPCFVEMDRKPPEFAAGAVRVHPAVRAVMRECGQGGWIGASAPYDHGGQQMPNTVMCAFRSIFSAANYSASVYPLLTTGAAHLILSFGAKELIDTYVPKMFAGEWQGTMALTEPQAGSSLTDLTTTARPTKYPCYLLKGQKIFISCAEHDGADNVVNLLLARIEGAPPGIKGISLFVVPKLRPDGKGGLEPNDIVCTGIYHKLGYRGAPITQLALGDNGDCRGWLVGQPHAGLKYMFQMMNEARVDVGMAAAAIASAAYHASLAYAKERPQGRRITEKDPTKPQVPIINHADIKRMLLFQKAVIEGAFGLLFQCAYWTDIIMTSSDPAEKERAELLLDLLTPIAKSYPSEMAIVTVSAGLQCLGGYGYCDEFTLEQYYRDVRIHAIHEGTTGIQGMDLLGRKVVMKNGKAFMLFLAEADKTIATANAQAQLAPHAQALAASLEVLKDVTGHLTGLAIKGEIELFLADAAVYLEFFGLIAIAWQWLVQAEVATRALAANPSSADVNFYQGKLHAFRYFFSYELPKTAGLAARLKNSDGLTVAMKEEYFDV
jgi:alkylation response protein AidB-like acyl-CoA dehydrogenase